MSKKELKLQPLITLDKITDTALDKLLNNEDVTLRAYEKNITDSLHRHTQIVLGAEPEQDLTDTIEDTTGKILDSIDKMNHCCFKVGMQTGAQLMLELLQTL